MICTKCYGTGTYLGQGMMRLDCNCKDTVNNNTDSVELKDVDKKSDSYKSAIADLMKLNPKMSRKDAIKMFNETYDKV